MRSAMLGAGVRRFKSRTAWGVLAITFIVVVVGNLLLSRPSDTVNDPVGRHVPAALLCDYYEHEIEHAPPRDPSGSMQRRELYYRTPSDPIDALCKCLRSSPADNETRLKLLAWQRNWAAGDPACVSASAAHDLAVMTEASSVDDLTLLEAGRGFNWLVDDAFAAQFYKAALRRATHDRSDLKPGDPRCLPFLRGLDQTKALWQLKDYEGLELRFRFARRFNLPLSVESRRAGCLLVDALYYQNRIDEALATVMQVQAENQRAGDLGALDKSDLYEMDYLQGFLLHCAGRHKAAIPFLKRVCSAGDHAKAATDYLFSSYMELERFDDAKALLDDYVKHFHLSASDQRSLRDDLLQARQAAEGRNAIAQLLKD